MQVCKSSWLTEDTCENLVHPSTPSTAQPGRCTENTQQGSLLLSNPEANSNNLIPVSSLRRFKWKHISHYNTKPFPIVSSWVSIWSFHASVTPFSRSDMQDITDNCLAFLSLPLKVKTTLSVLTWWGSGRHSHLSTARWKTPHAAP